jgi:photosystem II stability/assembly factor-like uncharacterized protein
VRSFFLRLPAVCFVAASAACSGGGTTATPTDAGAIASDSGTTSDGGGNTDDGGGSSDGGPVNPCPLMSGGQLRFDQDLHGVWAAAKDDVWLVGDKGRVLHWNGVALAPRASGTTTDFQGVWGRSGDDVWLVGNGQILHWDGQALLDATPKNVPALGLRAVSGTADGLVFAGGDKGLVIRRGKDGVWQQEKSASQLDIQALAVVDAGLVWAVGPQGQALKLSGGSWSTTQMPKASKTLRAVTASPQGRLFAAGDKGYLAATGATTWDETPANDPQSRDLFGIWAPADDEAWALGAKGALLHYIGKKWQLEDIAGTYMKTRTFYAATGNGGPAAQRFGYAVGAAGAGVRFDGSAWQDFEARLKANLNAVAAADDGALYAVGQGGLWLRAADAKSEFLDMAAPVTSADLVDVISDGGDVWAVGARASCTDKCGVLVGRQAGAWVVEQPLAGKPLAGIARLGAGDLLVVAQTGEAARRKAGQWTSEATGSQLPLASVSASGGEAFAVGGFCSILHRKADGVWEAESVDGCASDLARVLTWGNGEAAAVGKDDGSVLVRQNGKWSVVSQNPGSGLYGLTRKTDGTVVAVGFGGALVVGKPGGAWQKLEGCPSFLQGVAASAKGTVAVGQAGAVFLVAEKLP